MSKQQEDRSADVLVVGAGNAALCAALSAAEQGARVLVLERSPKDSRGGNSTFTGGAFRVAYDGTDDIVRLVKDLSEDEIARSDYGSYPADQFFDESQFESYRALGFHIAEKVFTRPITNPTGEAEQMFERFRATRSA